MRQKKRKTTSTKLPVFDKIILGLNIIIVVLLLLSYWAPDTDPRQNSFIAILGFCYQIILVVNIVFVVFWIFKRPVFSLISIISILLGYNTFFSYIQFNSVQDQPSKESLRILNYNVRQFKGVEKFDNLPIQQQIVDAISESNPAIVSFEEFATNQLEPDTTISFLKNTLKLKYSFVKYFNARKNAPTLMGNSIFSKFPIVDTGVIPSPKLLQTKSIFADIKYNDKIIRVYSIHLSAVTIRDNEKSQYLNGNVSVGSSSFIQRKLASAFVARSLEVSYIKKHIAKCPYPYIIAGDFNDTPNSYSVNEIGYGLKNAFIEKGRGFETTYYSSYPLHIDHIFASPEFDILGYQSIDKKISDHKPVIADVQLTK